MRNQDVKLMENIFDILNETVSVERRNEWAHERMYSITRWITGMPGGGGNSPGMDGLIAEVEELSEIYGEKLRKCLNDLKRAERVLNGIENQRFRTFVQMFYIDRVQKAEILREMNMTEYVFNKCRERIEQAENMKKVDWPEKDPKN